ncbi:MAG: nucleotidyltransferase domain-containing protein [Candidatus Diapherotrites archaeon]
MFDKINGSTAKVLNLFLDDPQREFYLREIARIAKISSSTSKRALDELKKTELIKEERKANLRIFSAEQESQTFKELKKIKNLEWIKKKKLVENIVDESTISVVLFGSFALGTNTKESDLDVLVITSKRKPVKIKELDGVEVQLIQKTLKEFRELEKKDNPFYTEIISTGIALYGGMPA